MDTIMDEINHHYNSLRDAKNTGSFNGLPVSELEYHIAKMVDRFLIITGHGRKEIRVSICDSNFNKRQQMELDLEGKE
jgi:hypothetical protein